MSLPYDFSLYSDGVVVPLGPGIDTKVTNPRGYTLNYNGECVCSDENLYRSSAIILIFTCCVFSQ